MHAFKGKNNWEVGIIPLNIVILLDLVLHFLFVCVVFFFLTILQSKLGGKSIEFAKNTIEPVP